MDFDISKIRELADLAIDKNLAEVTVQDGEQSVTIKLPFGQPAGQPQVVYTPPPPAQPMALPGATEEPAAAAPGITAGDEQYHKITSPMVGTFYSAPSPDSPPYVKEGDSISKGQVLCIIEAMKMMNELESEVSGKIVKILADNAQPVEFGQAILLVDTNS